MVTFLSDRASLGSNDQIDWSSLGPLDDPFDPVSGFNILPNSFSATSQNGLELFLDIPPAEPGITPPFVFRTLPAPGIETNYGTGDFILFTGLLPAPPPAPGNPGPLTITFDTPVLGAGAQIAVDDIFDFTAFISAFDDSDRLLGTFSVPGTSSVELDDSAVFLGIVSDTPNISRLVFSSDIPNSAIGINNLSIVNPNLTENENDELFASTNDRLFGGSGNDTLDATDGSGNNRLFGGADNDELIAGGGDRLFGGSGDDLLDAAASGNNFLLGNRGSDRLFAGTNDRLFAGSGDDLIVASAGNGNNRLFGGAGNDLFFLGSNDLVVGGDGDDRFFASNGGNNIINGGAGADRFWIANSELPETPNIITDFELAVDAIGISRLGISSIDELSFKQLGLDAAISIAGSDIAILFNIQATELEANGTFVFL